MISKINIRKFLEHEAYELRRYSLLMTTKAGSGHPTSALSAADIVAALFFYAMSYDPKNFNNPNNDRFILSKGHASPLLYAAWKEVGAIDEKELMTYRSIDSSLEGHPTLRFPYTEAATGSLGMGLSIGAGMALGAKMHHRDYYTYVLMGDSEVSEGSVWEAAEIAHYYKLDNLIAFIDCNRLGQTGETMHGYHANRYAQKFEAFGWKALIIDGHDMLQIMHALDKAHEHVGHPTIIIAKTVKGYGVEEVEDKNGFHGKAFPKDKINEVLGELERRFPKAAQASSYTWEPTIPGGDANLPTSCVGRQMKIPTYKEGDELPTRKAYGEALTALGRVCESVISLDGEVKNSTYAEIFAKRFPKRFIQCFIAEQNMVSMAVGLERRGFTPFVSTFSAFFSRAFDQVRMAAISTANLRLVGSHAGVSIGQDGPSQMGLEDISLMRTLPGSIVLYPCDAVSTYKLVGKMAEYNQGISYLRTTRMATPIIYNDTEEFPIGGCKVLKQSDNDVACVIGAGITLVQALKAYDQLQKEGISIAVIDLYSVKPFDYKTVVAVAKKAQSRIITIEDHYLEGGIGETIAYDVRHDNISIDCLAVRQLPRSGKPEELLALMEIDAAAIIKKVKALL